MIVDQLFNNKNNTNESLADQIMAAAAAAGLNARRAGTPEQERERSRQILAQRQQEREEQARQAALDDARDLGDLKDEYKKMRELYQSLGGSNWQYADREQNLTDAERQARAMEPEMNRLAARIRAAEQVISKENTQGIREGWREEVQDLEDWANVVREKLSKTPAGQRLSLAQKLSQIENRNFGSELEDRARYNPQTGKPDAGRTLKGLTNVVYEVYTSLERQQNQGPQAGGGGSVSVDMSVANQMAQDREDQNMANHYQQHIENYALLSNPEFAEWYEQAKQSLLANPSDENAKKWSANQVERFGSKLIGQSSPWMAGRTEAYYTDAIKRILDNDVALMYEIERRQRRNREEFMENLDAWRKAWPRATDKQKAELANMIGMTVEDLEELVATGQESASVVRESATKRRVFKKLTEDILKEDPVYRKFKRVGRYIAERKMTEKEILQVFADVEDGMTDKATGANRTFLGRGKDTAADFAGGVKNAFSSVMNSIQSSVPVAAVDVAYDQATDALANVTGGQKGKIMQAIKGYRNLVKEYPKAAGFAKAALVAIAGLATGGAGLPAIAGLTYALDSAIRGDKLSSVIGKGAGAAAVTWGGQKLAGMFSGDAQAATMQDYAQAPTGAPVDGSVYTVQSGDQLGYIAQANGSTTQELIKANPGIDFSKPLQVGQELSLPATTGTGTGSVWQGYQGGVYGDATPGPELLGGPGTGGATSAATTSGSGTLSGVTAQQIYQSPVYQQAYAQEIAKWGASPSAQAIQTAERIATLKAKAAMAGAVRESFDFSKIKLRKLPASELIDQKLTKMAWALNESVGKPQGRSVHITTRGIDALFENIQILAELDLKNALAKRSTQDLENYLVGRPDTDVTRQVKAEVERRKASGDPGPTTAPMPTMDTAPIDEVPPTSFGTVPSPTPAPTPTPAPKPAPAPTTPTGDAAGPGREQLPDLYRPDMPDAPTQPADAKKKSWFGKGLDALDRGVGAVGGALGTLGRQFTRNVTKEKLKMDWHQGGKPTDSDQLSSWLVSQGVPIGVVNGVYSKMGLPVSAQPQQATQDTTAKTTPTTTTTTTTPDTTKDGSLTVASGLVNPKTNKPYTRQELRDLHADNLKNTPVPVGPVQTPAPTVPAITPTPVTTTTTAPAQTTTVASNATGGAPGFNYNNVMQMPGMQKYAKKPAAKPANFAGPSGYGKTTMSVKPMTGVPGVKPAAPATATAAAPAKPRVTAGGPTQAEREKYDQIVANALAKPVAEMLELVTCKEDITRIKRFVDETFVRYNAVDAEAMAARNQLIEHISYQGAVNRRKNAQKEAK